MSLFATESGSQEAVATVTDNQDPDRRGRIRVTCAAILGDESRSLPMWVETALPWGWFVIPDVGRQVTISYSLGTSSDEIGGQSTISNMDVKWTGLALFTDETAVDSSPVGSEFTAKNYGKRRGFKTPRGHVLLFDDTTGDEQIRMSWAGGSKAEPKSAFLSFDSDGSFVSQDAGGSLFYQNANGEASLVHSSGGYFMLSDDGITIRDQHNNAIVMNADGISILSSGPINVMGTDTVVKNGLHFVDQVGIASNVGGAIAIMNSSTVAGATLKASLPGAVPADGVALLAGVDVVTKL